VYAVIYKNNTKNKDTTTNEKVMSHLQPKKKSNHKTNKEQEKSPREKCFDCKHLSIATRLYLKPIRKIIFQFRN